MEKLTLIDKFKKELTEFTEELHKKRKDLGEADSAKESRFPTGRVELEDNINILERTVDSLKKRIKNLERSTDTMKICLDGDNMEIVLVKNEGDLANGLVSMRSPLGKALSKAKKGDTVKLDSGLEVTVL